MSLSLPADFGGQAAGLPIINPAYGPANAAAMGQQAWQQSLQNAQAQTQETQQRARGLTLSNDATEANLQNQIDSKAAEYQSEGAQARGKQWSAMDQDYYKLASTLDQLPKDQQERAIRERAATFGLNGDSAVQRYQGGAGDIASGVAAATPGPHASAAANQLPAHQAHAAAMLQASEPYQLEKLKSSTALQQTGLTTETQRAVAGMEIKGQMDRAVLAASTNPEQAPYLFKGIMQDALNRGDTATAKDALDRADAIVNLDVKRKVLAGMASGLLLPSALGITGPDQLSSVMHSMLSAANDNKPGQVPGGISGTTPGGMGYRQINPGQGPQLPQANPGSAIATPGAGPAPMAPQGPPQAPPVPQQGPGVPSNPQMNPDNPGRLQVLQQELQAEMAKPDSDPMKASNIRQLQQAVAFTQSHLGAPAQAPQGPPAPQAPPQMAPQGPPQAQAPQQISGNDEQRLVIGAAHQLSQRYNRAQLIQLLQEGQRELQATQGSISARLKVQAAALALQKVQQ
jgi:hypothetical protein